MSNETGRYVNSYANYLQYYFLQSYMDGTLAFRRAPVQVS